MAAPGLMPTRRFSPQARRRLQVVFAKAWEALVEAYREQAVEFVRRLGARLPVEEAFERYLREVGVPAPMEPAVRSRALIALAPLMQAAPAPDPEPRSPSWSPLRPDQLFDALKRRAQSSEEINLACRLRACVSDEALAAAHVGMALETAEVLAGETGPDEAIMHYVRNFNLPAVEAQIIFQRAMALWAERLPPVEAAGRGARPAAVGAIAEGAAFGLRVV